MVTDASLELYKSRVKMIEDEYKSACMKNIQHEEYQNKYNEVRLAEEELTTYFRLLKHIRDVLDVYMVNYSRARRDRIETMCEEILQVLYPTEDFGVLLDIDKSYSKLRAQLFIGHKDQPLSKWHSPKSSNGGFVQQLAVAAVIHCICTMLNVPVMLMDEQFCSSDSENASIVPKIFIKRREGQQTLLIEHKPEIYEDCPRRMIHLNKNRVKGYIDKIEYEDIQ